MTSIWNMFKGVGAVDRNIWFVHGRQKSSLVCRFLVLARCFNLHMDYLLQGVKINVATGFWLCGLYAHYWIEDDIDWLYKKQILS